MIPYQDLVAALERWRVRNGLPVSGGGTVSAPSASYGSAPIAAPMAAPARPTPVPAPPAAGTRSTMYGMPAAPAPAPAKIPTRPQTDEPLDLGDADVLDEDMLNNEGGDFAMNFGGNKTAPLPLEDEEPEEESTSIGPPHEPPPLSPFGTEPGIDTFDAEDEILDESDDPISGPRHRS